MALWPSDGIWGQRSRWTLVWVMACCMMAPSHYRYTMAPSYCLNQCWLIIRQSSDIRFKIISLVIPQPSITKISLKITYLKLHSNLPGVNELMTVLTHGCVLSDLSSVLFYTKQPLHGGIDRKGLAEDQYAKISLLVNIISYLQHVIECSFQRDVILNFCEAIYLLVFILKYVDVT